MTTSTNAFDHDSYRMAQYLAETYNHARHVWIKPASPTYAADFDGNDPFDKSLKGVLCWTRGENGLATAVDVTPELEKEIRETWHQLK